MTRNEQLDSLIEELSDELAGDHHVESTEDSYAVVQIFDTDEEIRLNRQRCLLVFQSVDSLERLIETLGLTDDDSVILHALKVPGEVLDALESSFAAVDEA